MTLEDFGTVAGVWEDSKKAAFWFLPDEQAATFDENKRGLLRIWVKCDLWVAEANGHIVGFLGISGNYVDSLFIHPEVLRVGFGTLLLDYAKGLSPEGLILDVYEKNEPARGFYESQGFEAVKSDVTPPPENEPFLEYQWQPEDCREVARPPRLLKRKDRGRIRRALGAHGSPRFGFSMLLTSANGEVERVMEYGNTVETAEERKLRMKWQGSPRMRLMQFGLGLTSVEVTLAVVALFLF